jgi:hypothetical protein
LDSRVMNFSSSGVFSVKTEFCVATPTWTAQSGSGAAYPSGLKPQPGRKGRLGFRIKVVMDRRPKIAFRRLAIEKSVSATLENALAPAPNGPCVRHGYPQDDHREGVTLAQV